jgi:predicted  nucleic acid-binding Zn-ribbon protein
MHDCPKCGHDLDFGRAAIGSLVYGFCPCCGWDSYEEYMSERLAFPLEKDDDDAS